MYLIIRTDLQDEKEINHHGETRIVKVKEDDDENTGERNKYVDPVDHLFQVMKNLPEESNGVEEGFNRDLIHKDERIQDKALKAYYANFEINSEQKRKILNVCINFSRKIKPVIAAIFVISYWAAGLWNYNKME